MKKTLIIPYFGAFPDTFGIWLESCGNNPGFNWIIFTDIETDIPFPENVTVIKKTFNEIRSLIQSRFDFEISLETPYKFCDFRPAFGSIFSEYLTDSDFWGYCDMDTVWGDISHFLDDGIFEENDKIMTNGHLCFVRNTPEINENFRKYDGYRLVFSTPANYAYDEMSVWGGYHFGFNTEMKKSGFKVFKDYSYVADLDFRKKPFQPCGDPAAHAYLYQDGHITDVMAKEKEDDEHEIMYVHFQKRKIENRVHEYKGTYLFVPDFVTDDVSLMDRPDFVQKYLQPGDNPEMMKKHKKSERKNKFLKFKYEPEKLRSVVLRSVLIVKSLLGGNDGT